MAAVAAAAVAVAAAAAAAAAVKLDLAEKYILFLTTIRSRIPTYDDYKKIDRSRSGTPDPAARCVRVCDNDDMRTL